MAKKKKNVPKAQGRHNSNGQGRGDTQLHIPNSPQRTYTIVDHRLEKPSFTIRQIRKGDEVCYEVTGDLTAPVPPIRESKYLD